MACRVVTIDEGGRLKPDREGARVNAQSARYRYRIGGDGLVPYPAAEWQGNRHRFAFVVPNLLAPQTLFPNACRRRRMPSIIDRIREWVHARTRSSEAGSDYDGFLSYSGEWHAIAVGAFFGLVTAITLRPEVAAFFVLAIMGASKVKSDHLRDAAKEVAYSGGAFVVLFALGFAVRVVVGF